MSEQRTLDREEPNYFGAGPALLPTSVLQQAAYDLISYEGDNIGIGKSHIVLNLQLKLSMTLRKI